MGIMEQLPKINLSNLQLISLLGHGGMATVWKARQLSLDRLVAVKILAPSFATTSEDIAQFRQEAQAAARLKHTGIVHVYDANFSEGLYYFIMELVDGYTMGELLRRKGHILMEDALTVAESVAIALDYAWGTYRMVHCDIKPDNIMVDADGTVKLTDLGLCRSIVFLKSEHAGDVADEVIGTPAYMSPEQVYGTHQLDCRADIYALGATLYHMVSGKMLFDGQSDEDMMRSHVGLAQAPDICSLMPTISGSFALLLEKMLLKDPQHRHQDWGQVLADLVRVRANQPPRPALVSKQGSSMQRIPTP